MTTESVNGEHSDFRPPAKTARSRLIVFLTLTLFTSSDQMVSQPWTVSGQRNVTWIHDARHHQTNRHEVSSTVHVQQEDRSHLLPTTATRHPSYQWSTDSDRQQEMTSSDARTRRLPDVIIIGVKKCGTRALLEFIRAHPHVRATGHEVHFFDRHYDKGLDWYRSRMPMTSRGQLTVEKTPSYFVSANVAQRVYNMSRDIRLLVVVRDPVTRALSDFTQAQFKRRRRRQSFHIGGDLIDTDKRSSFERRAFMDAEHNVVDTSWSAIDIGLYERHARHWLEVFPRQQIHFVDGERLITDPAAQLFNVQTFLGLTPLITQRNFYFNKTKGFPCLVRRPRTSDESVHCLGKTKGRTHPTVDVEVLKKLRDFYRPYNAKFYALTGDNFGWE